VTVVLAYFRVSFIGFTLKQLTQMHIVAIAWIYVVFMMAITEANAVAGVMTFLLYGVLPLTIVLYLMGTPQRKRNRQRAENSARLAAQRKAAATAATAAQTPVSSEKTDE
jgi:hypothetical protein